MPTRNNFWFDYKCDSNKDYKKLPFFHSTCSEVLTDIEYDRFIFKTSKLDKYHDEFKIFFFYGNPVYSSDKWYKTVILGFNFKEINRKLSLTPIDSGMLAGLNKNGITKLLGENDKPEDIKNYLEQYKESFELNELIPSINKYIEHWFGDLQKYFDSNVKEKIDYPPKRINSIHDKLLNGFDDLEKIFFKKFLENNNLDLDKRSKTVELAINSEVSMTHLAELCFLAIPKNHQSIDLIRKYFNINEEDFNAIKYEYEPNNSLDDLMKECREAYKKKILDNFNL